MAECFKEVTRVPICLEKGKKYQVELQGNEVVISKEVKESAWINVTDLCYPEYRKSCHCDGRYIAVMYKSGRTEKLAAVIGIAGIQPQHDFKIEKPSGAFTSFQVLMRNK